MNDVRARRKTVTMIQDDMMRTISIERLRQIELQSLEWLGLEP